MTVSKGSFFGGLHYRQEKQAEEFGRFKIYEQGYMNVTCGVPGFRCVGVRMVRKEKTWNVKSGLVH